MTNVFDDNVWDQAIEDGPEDGALTDSGSDVSPGWIALGALSLVAGGAAVAVARRRKQSDAA